MNKMFVPYRLSLELKELGFDDRVVAKYQKLHEGAKYVFQLLLKERNCNSIDTAISAPTYQQVWEWFEDEHQLFSEQSNILLDYAISTTKDGIKIIKPLETDSKYKNREEVKEARVKHLIKIVKEWKQTK